MMTSLRVNFGYEKIQSVTGWTEDELDARESELDFFLSQELVNRFPSVEECQGIAFYALGEDFLIEAFDEDGSPVEGPPIDLLEKIIQNATTQIDNHYNS